MARTSNSTTRRQRSPEQRSGSRLANLRLIPRMKKQCRVFSRTTHANAEQKEQQGASPRSLISLSQSFESDATETTTSTTVSVSVKPTKSVRFDDALNEAHANTTGLFKEDYRTQWYNRDDIREFKTMAIFLATDFERLDRECSIPFSYGRILQHTYRQCIHSSNHLQATSHPLHDNASVLTSTEEGILRDRLQSTIAILGLDRHIVGGFVNDILCRRREMITVIRDIQQMPNDDSTKSFVDKAELIRTCCEHTSRPSRLYASHLGKALAEA